MRANLKAAAGRLGGTYLALETYMIITFLWHYRLAPIYAKQLYQKRQRPAGLRPSPR